VIKLSFFKKPKLWTLVAILIGLLLLANYLPLSTFTQGSSVQFVDTTSWTYSEKVSGNAIPHNAVFRDSSSLPFGSSFKDNTIIMPISYTYGWWYGAPATTITCEAGKSFDGKKGPMVYATSWELSKENLLDEKAIEIWDDEKAWISINPYPFSKDYGVYETHQVTNETGTYIVETHKKQDYYAYRFYFSVNIKVTGSQVIFTLNGAPDIHYSCISDLINYMNSNSRISNGKVVISIGIPSMAIQSNTDWFGIAGVFLAKKGLVTQHTGPEGSSLSLTPSYGHSVLPMYKDPELTQQASYVFNSYEELSKYNSPEAIQKAVEETLSNRVYIPISINEIGTVYYYVDPGYFEQNLNKYYKYTEPSGTLWIIYDVITKQKVSYFDVINYVNPPPGGTYGSIRGRVTDATTGGMTGLGGVTVELVGTNVIATTDGDGNFRMTNIAQGNYILKFSAPWRETVFQSVSVFAGKETVVNVSMQLSGWLNILWMVIVLPIIVVLGLWIFLKIWKRRKE
jgi:hypothetical protein